MKKPLIITIILLLVPAGTLLWWFSDKQVIKRQTHALAKCLNVEAEDGKSSRAIRNQSFSSLLAPDFTGKLELNNFNDEVNHSDVITAHQFLVINCQSSEASVTDFKITSISENSATVTAAFAGKVTQHSGKTYEEAANATLIWEKNDNDIWLLKNIIVK